MKTKMKMTTTTTSTTTATAAAATDDYLIIKALRNMSAYSLFLQIAGVKTNNIPSHSTWTRKRYYSALSALTHAGLVVKHRDDQEYHLTSLGKLVDKAIAQIQTAARYHAQLKAWDAVKNDKKMTTPDKLHVLATLVQDADIMKAVM